MSLSQHGPAGVTTLTGIVSIEEEVSCKVKCRWVCMHDASGCGHMFYRDSIGKHLVAALASPTRILANDSQPDNVQQFIAEQKNNRSDHLYILFGCHIILKL